MAIRSQRPSLVDMSATHPCGTAEASSRHQFRHRTGCIALRMLAAMIACAGFTTMPDIMLPVNAPEHQGPAVASYSQPVQALVRFLSRSQPAIPVTLHHDTTQPRRQQHMYCWAVYAVTTRFCSIVMRTCMLLTFALRAASSNTMAAPIPFVPPVTTHVFDCSPNRCKATTAALALAWIKGVIS